MRSHEHQDIELLGRELVSARVREKRLEQRLDAAEKLITTLSTGILDLKKKGFDAPDKPRAVKKPVVPKDLRSDEQLVKEREEETVKRMVEDFTRQGADPKAAEKEARRIREEVTSTTIHAGG